MYFYRTGEPCVMLTYLGSTAKLPARFKFVSAAGTATYPIPLKVTQTEEMQSLLTTFFSEYPLQIQGRSADDFEWRAFTASPTGDVWALVPDLLDGPNDGHVEPNDNESVDYYAIAVHVADDFLSLQGVTRKPNAVAYHLSDLPRVKQAWQFATDVMRATHQIDINDFLPEG